MTITLTHEQEAWIDAHVASGRFASVEDAIRQLIDERIAELDIEGDDLAWAKPLVDEARDAIARGDVLTLKSTAPATRSALQLFGRAARVRK